MIDLREQRQREPAAWDSCFEVSDGGEPCGIVLEQVRSSLFHLRCRIRYVGPVSPGLEGVIREIDGATLPTTDLASVPAALQWFVSRYGPHTPAALLHDRLVGEEEATGISRAQADRYFRDMLGTLRVPLLRRWLMWAAVTFGTRWCAKGWARVGLLLWVIASTIGIASTVWAVATGSWLLVGATLLAPLAFGLLWGRQWSAGVVAAYSAPWLVPPTLLAGGGYGVYWVLERVIGAVVPSERRRDLKPLPFDKF